MNYSGSQENRNSSSFKEVLRDPEYRLVMLAAASCFMMSILIHFPYPKTGAPFYSDIVGSWSRLNSSGKPEVVAGIPYVTYQFEYPTICGLITWIGGWGSGGSEANFAAIEFAILFLFALLTAHFLFLFLKHLNLEHSRQLVYSVFAPSLLFFGAYNFDIVQTFFVLFSLYTFICRSKLKASAISLGLGVVTKLSPIFLLPLFLEEISGNKGRVVYTALNGAVIAIFNIPFMVANYGVWYDGYKFLANYIIEDSFLVWIFNSDTSIIAKYCSDILLAFALSAIYIALRQKPLLIRSFMVFGVLILFSTFAPPQLNIDLLPFFALIPIAPISLFYLLEFANVAIILSYFNTSSGYASLPGMTQLFALARQIFLAVILLIHVKVLKFSRLRGK